MNVSGAVCAPAAQLEWLFDSPSDDSAFKLERTPVCLVGQGGTTGAQDGANRTIELGLVQNRAEPVCASISVQLKKT